MVDCVFFFKQKTAYEMRISDWSSDVCSSDLPAIKHPVAETLRHRVLPRGWYAIVVTMVVALVALSVYQLFNLGAYAGWVMLDLTYLGLLLALQIGRASCRDRVCQYV